MPLMASSKPIRAGGSSSALAAGGFSPAMGLASGGGMEDLGISTGVVVVVV